MEEQRLTQAQSAAAEVPLISSSKKKRGKKDVGTPLPTQNGEGDSMSINSGILLVIFASSPPAATTILVLISKYVCVKPFGPREVGGHLDPAMEAQRPREHSKLRLRRPHKTVVEPLQWPSPVRA